jgi:hypothetical protein
MPAFNSETPRLTRTYQGHNVLVPAAIVEGHTLTGTEAAWANSTIATIMGNKLGGVIRRELAKVDTARAALHNQGKWDGAIVEVKGKGGKVSRVPAPATEADLTDFSAQDVIDALYGDFVLAPGDEKSASDPMSKMIRALAEKDASERIKAKGHTVAAFKKAEASTDDYSNKYEEFVAKVLRDKGDAFRAQVVALMEAQASAPEDDDSDLTL